MAVAPPHLSEAGGQLRRVQQGRSRNCQRAAPGERERCPDETRFPSTSYARDPLSPPFQVNLVWGQRFLQTALLVKPTGPARPWRAIPVAFRHTPQYKVLEGLCWPRGTQDRPLRLILIKAAGLASPAAVAALPARLDHVVAKGGGR